MHAELRRSLHNVLMIVLVLGTFGQAKAIDFFKGTYKEALLAAEAANKPVLLYFTAKWCGPCRQMERQVFNLNSVSEAVADRVIPLKVDYDSHEGEQLARQYHVPAIPAFIIITSQQEAITRHIGGLPADQFLALITSQARQDISQEDKQHFQEEQALASRWRLETGVQAGVNLMQLSGYGPTYQPGYQVGLLLSFTRKRFSIRPGITLASKGGKAQGTPFAIRYLEFPTDLNYNLIKTGLVGFPGGLRLHVIPYWAVVVSQQENLIKRWDYGVKTGVSAFIGQTSTLELGIGYAAGLANVAQLAGSPFFNRGFYLTSTFVF